MKTTTKWWISAGVVLALGAATAIIAAPARAQTALKAGKTLEIIHMGTAGIMHKTVAIATVEVTSESGAYRVIITGQGASCTAQMATFAEALATRGEILSDKTTGIVCAEAQARVPEVVISSPPASGQGFRLRGGS